MTKLFDVVGVSAVRAGSPLKFRLANGKPARRARILERNGHADIFLVSLETAMGKEDAIAEFKAQYPQYAGVDAAKSKSKEIEAPKSKAAVAAAKEIDPEVETIDIALSPAAKLAVKRARAANKSKAPVVGEISKVA